MKASRSTGFRNLVMGLIGGSAAAVLLLAAFCFRSLWREFSVDDRKFQREIAEAADRNRIDPELVRALIFQESRFDAGCIGAAGEIGLMQILPQGAVAEYLRLRKCRPFSRRALFDPRLNLEIGCWYLARALKRWDQNVALALAQYNAGERRTVQWAAHFRNDPSLEAITIESTRKYVKNILARYHKYRQKKMARRNSSK